MELLQTLSPSASHCIKSFCNFIRILCLSADASQLWNWNCKQKYYIFFHSGNWESPFFWQVKRWPDLVNRVILCLVWRQLGAPVLKGGKEGGDLIKCPPRFTEGELLSFPECNSFFFLSLSTLRLHWRGFSAREVQKFQWDVNSNILRFSSG